MIESNASQGIFFLIVILGISIAFFITGIRARNTKRLIEGTPTSKIRSIAMGPVEIYGEVEVNTKSCLNSPFTNIDCVYYKFSIEEYKSRGKNSYWDIIDKGENKVPFYIKDDTGKVLIDLEDAELEIPAKNIYNSSFGVDPPKCVLDFLNKNNIAFEGFFGANKKMRFTEYYMKDKDKLYVFGNAQARDPTLSGSIDFSKQENKIIIKNKDNTFFYISDKPEKEILKKFKWLAIGGVYGGSAGIIICCFFIFASFGWIL
jgi:hypothetical protein